MAIKKPYPANIAVSCTKRSSSTTPTWFWG